jgi:predicted transposase
MEQIITAKLKLLTTPNQHDALRLTQLAYRDALNYISSYAFEHGKTSNEKQLHKGTYYDVRAQFKIPSEMTNNAIRQVGLTYKGLWTKVKENSKHLRKKLTKKRYKGLDKPPKFISPTITYNYGYDYGFKPNQQVSIKTLGKRIIIAYQGSNKHVALIQNGSTIKAGRLWYDKQRKQFYLLVALSLDITISPPETYSTIAGIDVGQRYLAVTATREHQRFFQAEQFGNKKIAMPGGKKNSSVKALVLP